MKDKDPRPKIEPEYLKNPKKLEKFKSDFLDIMRICAIFFIAIWILSGFGTVYIIQLFHNKYHFLGSMMVIFNLLLLGYLIHNRYKFYRQYRLKKIQKKRKKLHRKINEQKYKK